MLSVVNGFDREIKKQIFDTVSPITISSYNGQIDHWQELETTIKAFPEVKGIAPFASEQAMLTNSDLTLPAMLIGILPEKENKVSALSEKMIQGKLENLAANKFGIVIGKDLAKKLNVTLGDKIIVATLQGSFSTTNMTPRFKKFTVAGIFRAGGGGLGFDSKMAFIHLQDAQQLIAMGHDISSLHINIDNVYSTHAFPSAIKSTPPYLSVWDWTNQLGDFENIRMTKTMMFLSLS